MTHAFPLQIIFTLFISISIFLFSLTIPQEKSFDCANPAFYLQKLKEEKHIWKFKTHLYIMEKKLLSEVNQEENMLN